MGTIRSILKTYFKTGRKPTEAQFAELIDSFWHKDDTIGIADVNCLELELNEKAEAEVLNEHLGDTGIHVTAEEREAWNGKQDRISAGRNIEIDQNEISVTEYPDFCTETETATEEINGVTEGIHGTQFDAARQSLGNDWRMPTWEECREMVASCTFSEAEVNGVRVVRVTGPSGNSIFFPFSGHYGEREDDYSDGRTLFQTNTPEVWSSKAGGYNYQDGGYLYFYTYNDTAGASTNMYNYRHQGRPIRPVSPKKGVDLGLSVKWADRNLGASSPEQTGGYYAFGETTPKTSGFYWGGYSVATKENCGTARDAIYNAIRVTATEHLHKDSTEKHVTAEEREAWNAHAGDEEKHLGEGDREALDNLAALAGHVEDSDAHVTEEEREAWNGLQAKIDAAGHTLEFGVSNDGDYILTATLKDKNGTVLSTHNVNLPLETAIVGAVYADEVITFTLQSGEAFDVDVSAIVSGLVNSAEFEAHTGDSTAHVTAEEREAWNGKPDKLKGEISLSSQSLASIGKFSGNGAVVFDMFVTYHNVSFERMRVAIEFRGGQTPKIRQYGQNTLCEAQGVHFDPNDDTYTLVMYAKNDAHIYYEIVSWAGVEIASHEARRTTNGGSGEVALYSFDLEQDGLFKTEGIAPKQTGYNASVNFDDNMTNIENDRAGIRLRTGSQTIVDAAVTRVKRTLVSENADGSKQLAIAVDGELGPAIARSIAVSEWENMTETEQEAAKNGSLLLCITED